MTSMQADPQLTIAQILASGGSGYVPSMPTFGPPHAAFPGQGLLFDIHARPDLLAPIAFEQIDSQIGLTGVDDTSALVEQITPCYLPGVQDHYTSFASLGPAQKVETPHVGVGLAGGVFKGSATSPALVCIDGGIPVPKDAGLPRPQAGTPSTASDGGDEPLLAETAAQDGPTSVPKDMSKGKLERLIWLQLHCMSEAVSVAEDQIASGPCEHSSANRASFDAPTSLKEQDASCIGREHDDTDAQVGETTGGAAFSCGSVGHPDKCAAPCKYFRKRRGCMDGLACSHCHLCTWRPLRSQRGKRAAKSDAVSTVDLVPDFNLPPRL